MATSKILQIPQILEIKGSTIKIAHPDISKNYRTSLGAPILAAGTTMTPLDTGAITGGGFADNDWFIVGEVGDQETEENDVNGAVTRGTTMTVTNALSFDHEVNAPVTKIYERGIKIYGAATDGGAGSLILSIDAKTASGRQLADAAMIEWHRPYTEYTLLSTDTDFAFYYAEFTDGTTDSDESEYVAAAGLSSSSVMYMVNQALDLTNTVLDDQNITLDQCVKWADNAQVEISQFMFQEPSTGRYTQRDWAFEVDEDITTLTISENENVYSIADLSMKYQNEKSVIEIVLGSNEALEKITIQDMSKLLAFSPRTNLAVQAVAADTSITVDSNVEFTDSGTLYIGDEAITYTGKTGTTIFTGIPATGDGAITATHAIDAPIWQNAAPGTPTKYAVFNGDIIFDVPPEEDLDGYPIKIKFLKKLTSLTTASDTTEVTFSNVMQNYIASKIELRKGNAETAAAYKKEFDKRVLDNAISNSVPTLDYYTYYNFVST